MKLGDDEWWRALETGEAHLSGVIRKPLPGDEGVKATGMCGYTLTLAQILRGYPLELVCRDCRAIATKRIVEGT